MRRYSMGRYSLLRQTVGGLIFTLPVLTGLAVVWARWEVLLIWAFAAYGAVGYGRMYYQRGVIDGKRQADVLTIVCGDERWGPHRNCVHDPKSKSEWTPVDTPKETT